MKTIQKAWWLLGILLLLSPLGVLLPYWSNAGGAWGEWAPDTLQTLIGYIPSRLSELSGLWSAPLPDYGFKGGQAPGMHMKLIGYFLSGVIGMLIVMGLVLLLGRWLHRKDDSFVQTP